MRSILQQFWRDERGVTSLDYVLLSTLTIVGMIGSLEAMAQMIDQLYGRVNAALAIAVDQIR